MPSLEQGLHQTPQPQQHLKHPPSLNTSSNNPPQQVPYHHTNNNNNNNIHPSHNNNNSIGIMNNNLNPLQQQNLYQKASQNMMNIHQQQMMHNSSVSNKVNLDNERMYQSYNDDSLVINPPQQQQQYQSFDFHNTLPNGSGALKSNPANNTPLQKQQPLQQPPQNLNYNPMMGSPTRMNPSQMMNQMNQKGPNNNASSNGNMMHNNNVNNPNNYQSATMDKNIPNGAMQHSHSPDTQFFNQGTFSPQKGNQQQPMNMDNFKMTQNQMFYNQPPPPQQNNVPQVFQQNPKQVQMGDFTSQINNNMQNNQSNSPQTNTLNSKESLYQSFPTALHQYNYNAQSQQSKSTAAPVVEVISSLFKGFEFCLSGKFTLIQRKFETLILQHGGSVQKSINAVVTHLISTQDELQQDEKAVKVTKAIARNIPIITEDFIQDSIKHNNLQDVKNYMLPLPKDQKKDSKISSVEPNQTYESNDNEKKRKADDAFHFDSEDVKRLKQFEIAQTMNKNH